MIQSECYFASRTLASEEAAAKIISSLSAELTGGNEASFIVSGGSSPKACFNILAGAELAWNRIDVLMSDERYVAADHPDSNEGMTRRELLIRQAAEARMISMFGQGVSINRKCRQLEDEIGQLVKPYSTALLGMGEDGHFASLFPDFDRLDEGLDLANRHACMPVKTIASPFPRITLTLSELVKSKEVILLFFGAAKREVYEQSKQPGSAFPLARLLQQNKTPVRTIWAP